MEDALSKPHGLKTAPMCLKGHLPEKDRPRRPRQDTAEFTRMGATLVTLLDRGYFLPGSLSVLGHSGVRGLTTICVENVSFPTAKTIKIEYTGKNFTFWSKLIRSADAAGRSMRANMKSYMRGKSPGDLVFTLGDGSPFTPRMLNSYIQRSSGNPTATATTIRRFHATRLVRRALQRVQGGHLSPAELEGRILGRFVCGRYRPGILDAISIKLGHRPGKGRSWRALVAYSVDPSVWTEAAALGIELSRLAPKAR